MFHVIAQMLAEELNFVYGKKIQIHKVMCHQWSIACSTKRKKNCSEVSFSSDVSYKQTIFYLNKVFNCITDIPTKKSLWRVSMISLTKRM